MKTNLVKLLIVSCAFVPMAPHRAQAEDPALPAVTKPVAGAPDSSGPRIEFATPTYNFGKVNAGELVRHDFVFTNTGGALLEITDVRPGCGCTTAGTWDKRVEPGKTGVIPLQFNSANFDGAVTKSATVTCNDLIKSNQVLQITGTVWKPIQITPTMAIFKISEDSQTNETKVVRIVSHLDEPVTLSDVQCTNQAFQVELKTVKPGTEFELHITAVAPFTARSVNALVSLKTSSPSMPTITVGAYLMVEQAMMVTPNQITLPPGPLAASMSRAFVVRNNGTNSLALSDASLNLEGADVRVQETQPGRLFNLTVNFPAGFQIKPDQKLEVTLKSNHPKFALIKVPVFQSQIAIPPTTTRPASAPVRIVPTTPESPGTPSK